MYIFPIGRPRLVMLRLVAENEAVIVLSRFAVPHDDVEFAEQARAAVSVLSDRAGFVSADLGRNIDDPELWTITTRWQNVGSYRRALQGYESKMVVVPLLSRAIDEPSAYEDPELLGENEPRVLGLAD